ncbi:MAG TPA: NAD(P)/FAD-dependent oxidoreductase [Burkholderiaceae bacterium]|nr:NAD(P)/FAD-dependent oxidoreductase [Burkholderiaceae bacterium]
MADNDGMSQERVDCVVVGAGVVGLACARALAQAGREVVIVEAENAFGTATSARNSEVIHAGIYYPTGSLRAQLCVQGKALLYDYCASHQVNHRRCGKLIVAQDDAELAQLQAIELRARANGVTDLQWLTREQALALEPQLQCSRALLSPSTGIVDSHGLMLALLGDAQAAGAMLALQSPVQRATVAPDGIELDVGGDSAMTLLAASVVNSAGHGAPVLAAATQGLKAQHVPPRYFAKGNYFTLSGRSPFSRLVYPAPGESSHLGVHLTLDLGGQAKFGPSFHWVDGLDYRVDEHEAEHFYAEVRRYWPGLQEGALQPGYVGIRPKIRGPGEPAQDFRIDGPTSHGVPGLVNLFGIESPGLTSSLAIADRVTALLQKP